MCHYLSPDWHHFLTIISSLILSLSWTCTDHSALLCSWFSCIKDIHLASKQSRIVSHSFCVLCWQLANSWISLQEQQNLVIFWPALQGYCIYSSDLRLWKATAICPIYIEHISRTPSAYFLFTWTIIAAQRPIRITSGLGCLEAIIPYYKLSLQH